MNTLQSGRRAGGWTEEQPRTPAASHGDRQEVPAVELRRRGTAGTLLVAAAAAATVAIAGRLNLPYIDVVRVAIVVVFIFGFAVWRDRRPNDL